jgi:hypothetical protein
MKYRVSSQYNSHMLTGFLTSTDETSSNKYHYIFKNLFTFVSFFSPVILFFFSTVDVLKEPYCSKLHSSCLEVWRGREGKREHHYYLYILISMEISFLLLSFC